ncbi:aminotransferase class IV [Olivibacter sp. XZL3]|uniref:aminotransferase class IV n=1 Tax=Olivibacter sp. XZL3 TaxID=1735116 RepID=UPI001064970E|nr:aminotransferase class IV [Olivibacter sp. XZL3]
MNDRYINSNGNLMLESQPVIQSNNRSFRYGDGIFETMRWMDGDIRFLQYHIDRLQAGMNLLHLEGAAKFDAYFLREKTAELVKKNKLGTDARIRLNVYRAGAGLYSPETNKANYLLEASPLEHDGYQLNKTGVIIDVYREHKKPVNSLSHLKSSNALIYVLAGIERKRLGCDDILILNNDGFLCESLSSNIFVWYNKTLYTPALSEGCIAGVMRKVVIEMANEYGIEVVEAQISPEILHEADEMFLTNAIHGIYWVMGYKKKRYFNHLSKNLQDKLSKWHLASDLDEE